MKHAFCFMVHNEVELLKKTIQQLDNKHFDFYIHVDKKSDIHAFLPLKEIVHHSKIYIFQEIAVVWGDYSLIACEMFLFEQAMQQVYDYYHLLSGVDIPLVSNETIQQFFQEHKGKEFIDFASDRFTQSCKFRYEYYHYFQKYIGRSHELLQKLNRISIRFQKYFVARSKAFQNTMKSGANWCSITHKCVEYLVANKKQIKKQFQYTLCCDEVYKQTMIYHSKLKDKVYTLDPLNVQQTIFRYVDWERGNPYVFQEEDFDLLMNSNCLFARKLSFENVSSKRLVEKIYATHKKEKT